MVSPVGNSHRTYEDQNVGYSAAATPPTEEELKALEAEATAKAHAAAAARKALDQAQVQLNIADGHDKPFAQTTVNNAMAAWLKAQAEADDAQQALKKAKDAQSAPPDNTDSGNGTDPGSGSRVDLPGERDLQIQKKPYTTSAPPTKIEDIDLTGEDRASLFQLGVNGYISPEALLAWLENQTSLMYKDLGARMNGIEATNKQKAKIRDEMDKVKKEMAGSEDETVNKANQSKVDHYQHQLDTLGDDTQMRMIEVQEINSKINSLKQMASNLLATWERTDNALIGNIRG